MPSSAPIVFFFFFGLLQNVFLVQGSIDSFQFDVNDILNEKLMPAHLLIQELESFLKGTSNITRDHFYQRDNSNSNFTTAFSTMGFHRKMMNEYLATNFLAKQILSEFPLIPGPSIERRLGAPSSNSTTDVTEVEDKQRRRGKYIPNELLEDPGSVNYRSWLDKTTTLDDIQRQFSENSDTSGGDFKHLHRDTEIRRKSIESDDVGLEEEDFDDGDITGYAYSGGAVDSAASYPQAVSPSRHHLPFDASTNIQTFQPLRPVAGSKNGYYPPSEHENAHSENYSPVHHVQPQQQQHIKEIGLKDILDIALTTLAFLSFGMFILQVLMCITMNKDDTSNMMMMPMEAVDGGTGQDIDGATEEIRRRKRNSPTNLRMELMNELSRRVLHSIDAVLLIPKDDGRCHYRSLCEDNRFARQQKNGQKVWIPMWSLGISWFSSRMNSSSTTTGNMILESLKAAVVGLGNGDCEKIYRSCEMEMIADERAKLDKRIEKRELRNHFEWSA